jgi:hypothetical protein
MCHMRRRRIHVSHFEHMLQKYLLWWLDIVHAVLDAV